MYVLCFINFEMNNLYQITWHLHINSLENLLKLYVSIQNRYLVSRQVSNPYTLFPLYSPFSYLNVHILCQRSSLCNF